MKKILLFLILPFALHAQKNYTTLLNNYMQAAVSVNQFSGSVLVADHENIFYQKTFGTIDYANTTILDSNSMFDLGSITEEFTAAAILLLRDEGKLKLTDVITKYFPELPYNTVTIKHLLTHTSGLPDFYDEVLSNKWGTEKLATNADVVNALAKAKVPLGWQPGKRFDVYHYYTEYPLLASVIEKISGLSYADFMQQNIFTPLHLNNTKVFAELQVNKKLNSNHTEGVYFDEQKQKFFPSDSIRQMPPEFHYAVEGVVGGVGISSTAYDLFLFDQALKYPTLISATTKQEMFKSYVLKDTVNKYFLGYGVVTGKNEFGDYVQQKDEGNNITLGYITMLMNYPKEDFTIIVLSNKAKSSSNIAGVLSYILFDKEIVMPYIHKEVSIDTSLLDKYTGEYALPSITNVYKKNGTLWTTIPGEPDLKLLPESNTKFFSSDKEYDRQIEFKTDANGKVVKTYFIFSGLKKEAKRL
jgi:CubicO group peptidase (beta-lactamase class C family)